MSLKELFRKSKEGKLPFPIDKKGGSCEHCIHINRFFNDDDFICIECPSMIVGREGYYRTWDKCDRYVKHHDCTTCVYYKREEREDVIGDVSVKSTIYYCKKNHVIMSDIQPCWEYTGAVKFDD